MQVIDDFIEIAEKEIGYKETGVNITKYNEWADNINFWFTKVQGLAWCTSFVAWCAGELSAKYKDLELYHFCLDNKCCWSDHWMANFKNVKRFFEKPCVGDLAFKNGHVAIVYALNLSRNLVTVIEGNTHNSVEMSTYTCDYWLGFGRPYWEYFIESPQITETASAKEFVINQGIIIGREDGEMHWTDNLTREEMAIVLYRYWKKFLKDR